MDLGSRKHTPGDRLASIARGTTWAEGLGKPQSEVENETTYGKIMSMSRSEILFFSFIALSRRDHPSSSKQTLTEKYPFRLRNQQWNSFLLLKSDDRRF
jgi:hypothetical protein